MCRLPLLVLSCALAMACNPKDPEETGTVIVDSDPVVDDDADGWSVRDGDCDDANPEIHPGVDEICDGIDNDCDTVIDVGAVDAGVWYPDADGDGFGSAIALSYACERPEGHLTDASDCVDNDAAIHPQAREVCNGVDDDCDTLVDDDDTNEAEKWTALGQPAPTPLIGNPSTFYADLDGDGSPGDTSTTMACAPPAGFADAAPDDCDDNDATRYPGALEPAGSGLDTNCDNQVTCFVDNDNDGFGIGATTPHPLSDPDCTTAGAAPNSLDCDDDFDWINPDADEVCGDLVLGTTGLDEDCNGAVDDADPDLIGGPRWYTDADGDGYGGGAGQLSCVAPPGLTDEGGDCDDADVTRNPGEFETCNGIDDDCDGAVDDDATDGALWYPDLDGDGQGDDDGRLRFCTPPSGWSTNGDDCNDTNDTVYTGAPTVPCDGVENDCGSPTPEAGGARLDGLDMADLTTAVDAASPGSTIVLCEGDHSAVGLTPPDQITIESLGGPDDTRIVGDLRDGLFAVETHRTLTLRGVTLRDGTGYVGANRDGGAVWVGPDATLELDHVTLRGNQAARGGAVFLSSNAVGVFTDVLIENNTASNQSTTIIPSAGALFMDVGAEVTLVRTDLRDNSANECGAMEMGRNTTLTATESSVRGNESTSLRGGGICAEDGGTLITGLEIRNNETPSVGGGLTGEDLTLVDVTVRNNTSNLSGGGLWLSGTNTFTRVHIFDNESGFGGGGFDLFNGHVEITDSSVTGNHANFASNGGGADLDAATLQSNNTDWGARNTPDQNTPRDIYLSSLQQSFNFAAAATFFCDDGTGLCL